MKNAKMIVRILLGLGLLAFGLMKFLIEMPPPAEGSLMETFMAGAAASTYLMPLVGALEIITGLLLLINKYVPLALIIILPVMLNALLVHAFMDPAGIAGATIFFMLIVLLMAWNKDSYKEVLKA